MNVIPLLVILLVWNVAPCGANELEPLDVFKGQIEGAPENNKGKVNARRLISRIESNGEVDGEIVKNVLGQLGITDPLFDQLVSTVEKRIIHHPGLVAEVCGYAAQACVDVGENDRARIYFDRSITWLAKGEPPSPVERMKLYYAIAQYMVSIDEKDQAWAYCLQCLTASRPSLVQLTQDQLGRMARIENAVYMDMKSIAGENVELLGFLFKRVPVAHPQKELLLTEIVKQTCRVLKGRNVDAQRVLEAEAGLWMARAVDGDADSIDALERFVGKDPRVRSLLQSLLDPVDPAGASGRSLRASMALARTGDKELEKAIIALSLDDDHDNQESVMHLLARLHTVDSLGVLMRFIDDDKERPDQVITVDQGHGRDPLVIRSKRLSMQRLVLDALEAHAVKPPAIAPGDPPAKKVRQWKAWYASFVKRAAGDRH